MNKINFKLQGLHCEACVKMATLKFKKIDGVKEVKIDLTSGDAEINTETPIEIEKFKLALTDTDYTING
ncbi:MAG: Heavy metal transport/detoxification protein [Parcubacteria group bacterium GW2011_GWE2_39_37]|uniref:Heavy metal transport/detoxification protein n=1 Tax=Candidatus Falkowbacteria bacterium GW2011_GWF2_39_8 TaxID=1618642 RepID=A0A0G0Q665_9BACT|nr:MAG: Heavy metal transport/detoxification protein [Parcubacteria group bacterium GW2011_GWE2_39_37]KKR32841.1 MAG: Heavy metal transport/detoxification protein [Candidatus Falkowbacteria bacterium GW2011_GWF2_39_8]